MNKNKSLPFVIGGVVIVLALILVVVGQSGKKTKTMPVTPAAVDSTTSTTQTTSPVKGGTSATSTTTTTTKKAGEYTLADVAAHNNRSDCWTTINGGVYNVTNWIDQHPGGAQAIISLCGIDGSAAFNGQHGGERRPASELATFKVGTLVK